MHPRRRAAAFVAALSLALLGGLAQASPAAAAPVPLPDLGQVTVLEGFDHSKASATGQFLRRSGGNDFPTGKQYCTRSWHPSWCLQPLKAYAVLKERCGEFGSDVNIYIQNPNGRSAPRDLSETLVATGTGFGDRSFAPSGWSLFPIRNAPPGTYDYRVGWDPQQYLSFMHHWDGSKFVPAEHERLVLTCPSPPPPPPPVS